MRVCRHELGVDPQPRQFQPCLNNYKDPNRGCISDNAP